MPTVRKSMLHNLSVATRSLVDSAVTTAKIATSAITGAKIGTIGTDGSSGTAPIEICVTIADSAGNTDLVIPFNCEVMDAYALKTATNGGAGDSIQLKTGGGTAISDAMSLAISADGGIVRAASLDPATRTIASGGTLRFTAAKATSCGCVVVVKLHKRA